MWLLLAITAPKILPAATQLTTSPSSSYGPQLTLIQSSSGVAMRGHPEKPDREIPVFDLCCNASGTLFTGSWPILVEGSISGGFLIDAETCL
ncbi:hypothetical protein BJY00DRAFT_284515 [Aspergillus carlsbadensis]|nr:hypothetical protein BJY00DRAFT_284515 [Aspergillus carlsbadensis]